MFDRQVTVIDGRRFGGPSLCPPCVKDDEGPKPYRDPFLERTLRIHELLDAAGANVRRHGKVTLDDWDTAHGATAHRVAREFVSATLSARRFDPVRGLYICGPTGTGKTQLAVAVARELLLDPRTPENAVVIDRAERLVTQVRDTYGHGGTEAILARRERAHLWVLDDLGAENAAEDVLRILTDLLSAREGWPTIITSNLEPGALAERWKSPGWTRLDSRLGPNNFRAVKTKGEDRRFAA